MSARRFRRVIAVMTQHQDTKTQKSGVRKQKDGRAGASPRRRSGTVSNVEPLLRPRPTRGSAVPFHRLGVLVLEP